MHDFPILTVEWKELSFEGASPSPRYKAGSCLIPERQGQGNICSHFRVALPLHMA